MPRHLPRWRLPTARFLTDLTPDDFLVLEDGKPQRPSFVLPSGTLPLRAVLLIDRSASMSGAKLPRAVEAAALFAGRLEPDDTLGIITFNQQAARIHAFGDDPLRADTGSPIRSIKKRSLT